MNDEASGREEPREPPLLLLSMQPMKECILLERATGEGAPRTTGGGGTEIFLPNCGRRGSFYIRMGGVQMARAQEIKGNNTYNTQ